MKTWQHEETGYISHANECPGPRWYEVRGYVEQLDGEGATPAPTCTCGIGPHMVYCPLFAAKSLRDMDEADFQEAHG